MTTATIAAPATEAAGTRPSRLSARIWNFLVAIGERKAAAEMARYISSRGGHPTGDLARDAETIRSYFRIS